jgi:hypothetical protein
MGAELHPGACVRLQQDPDRKIESSLARHETLARQRAGGEVIERGVRLNRNDRA